jgi:hypothetical protein
LDNISQQLALRQAQTLGTLSELSDNAQ